LLQATTCMRKGLAQGPYVVARVEFQPATFRTQGTEPTTFSSTDEFLTGDVSEFESSCNAVWSSRNVRNRQRSMVLSKQDESIHCRRLVKWRTSSRSIILTFLLMLVTLYLIYYSITEALCNL